MDNTALQFSFEANQIRVVVDDAGGPWFCAKDVCEALDHSNHKMAVAQHCDEDGVTKHYLTDALGRKQEALCVNESGLYCLIFGSTKPEAKRFRRWVTSEVLPAIRQTGTYSTPAITQHVMQIPDGLAPDVLCIVLAREALLCVPGINPAAVAAHTLDAIENTTGAQVRSMARALPQVAVTTIETLNPTQIGERLGISARAVNIALDKAGLQRRGDNRQRWLPTDHGAKVASVTPFQRNGHAGVEIRWRPEVLEVLRPLVETNN